MSLRSDADKIIEESLRAVLPDQAVKRALKDYAVGEGKTILIAVGKAAWQMANAGRRVLGVWPFLCPHVFALVCMPPFGP